MIHRVHNSLVGSRIGRFFERLEKNLVILLKAAFAILYVVVWSHVGRELDVWGYAVYMCGNDIKKRNTK